MCHVSLLSAADRLRATNAFDGQLFIVRHLLILREIARNLDLAQKDEPGGKGGSGFTGSSGVAGECSAWLHESNAQASWSRILDTVSSVLSRTSTLLPGSLFTSLTSTRTEHLADAKRVLYIPVILHPCLSHPDRHSCSELIKI